MSLLDVVLGAAGCAVLFIIFALLRPAKSCSGDCGECVTGACKSEGGRS